MRSRSLPLVMARSVLGDARRAWTVRRWWPWPGMLLVVVPCMQVVALLWLIWQRTPDVPWWDEWDTVNFVHKFDRGWAGIADFWAFHNEHRILIPRLIDLPLIELTNWNRQIEMTFDLGIAVATASLLFVSLRRTLDSPIAFLALIAPSSLLILSFAQYENWLWAFQVTFIATVFGVALSAWTLATRPVGARGFGIAVAGALIASLSSFAGLMVWVAFLPALWGAGYRRARYPLCWIAVALAVFIPYLQGFPTHPHAAGSFGEILRYALVYLGAPVTAPDRFGPLSPILYGQAFACASIVLLVASLLISWRRHHDLARMTSWVGLALFALACMAITALGRGPANGVAQALESRYQAFSALWWLSVFAIVSMTAMRLVHHGGSPRIGPSRALRWGVAAGMALFLSVACASLLRANVAGFRAGREWMNPQRQNQQCIIQYDSAPDECLQPYFLPWRIRVSASYLEQERLSIFHDTQRLRVPDLARDLGTTRSSIDAIGAVDVARARPDPVLIMAGTHVTVRGWAVDSAAGTPAGAVFVSVDGTFHAWAVYGMARPDVAHALGSATYTNSGFSANIDADHFALGRHTLTIQIVAKDRGSYYESSQRVDMEVRAPANLPRLAADTQLAFGPRGGDSAAQYGDAPVIIPRGQGLMIDGWAVDANAGTPASGIFVTIDAEADLPATYGIERPDVSRALGAPAYLRSGFAMSIPGDALSPGKHTLTLKVISADGQAYYQSTERLIVEVH